MSEKNIQTINETGTAIAERPAITPMRMLEMAVEQGADLDKLEKLMALQERWEATEARKAYVAAMNAFKADPPEITKNKHVSFDTNKGQTDYNHATLDHVTDIIGTALSANNMSHKWTNEQLDGGIIKVTCTVTHVLGHSESNSLQSGADQSGGKNNIQAIASTVSYLQRYTLLGITGLATKETDNDGASIFEFITDEQVAELLELAGQVGANIEKFCVHMGVPSLSAFNTTQFDRAKAALEGKGNA